MKRFASVLMVMVLLISAIFMACSSSEEGTAKEGDTVKVLYIGTLDDGTVFDSSELHGGDPLEFTIGEGQLLPTFEQAVIGLSINESTTVRILADETEEVYGPSEVVLDLDQFSEDNLPEVGQQGQVPLENGRIIQVIVTEVSESSVTLQNANPIAGKDVNFEIQLVEIVTPPTPTPTPTPTTTPAPIQTPNL